MACTDFCCQQRTTAHPKVREVPCPKACLDRNLGGLHNASVISSRRTPINCFIMCMICLHTLDTSYVFAGREFAAVLRRLLLAALKPSVDRLQLWVEEGFLEDYFDEFLICTGESPQQRTLANLHCHK